jgi:hypothetical protein
VEGGPDEPAPQEESECDVDEVACFKGAVYYCEDGVWVRQEKCKYGCHYNAMECAAKPDVGETPDPKPEDKVCTDGDVQCADGVLKKCEDNAWAESDCPNGCNEEGTACKDGQPEPPGPIDQKECEGDAVVCEDGIKKTCSDGTWKTENCEYGCHENGVDCAEPACEAGKLLCADDQLKKCNGTEWVLEMPCDKGCKSNEACAAVCREGEIVCDGDMLKTCQNDAWSEKKCDSGCDESTKKCIEVNNNVPTRYLMKTLHSPITPYVVARMKDIYAKGTQSDNVFIKVGDSHYDYDFDGCFMKCFSKANQNKVTLDGRTELQAVIDAFQTKKDSFERQSKAAVGGSSTRNGIGQNTLVVDEMAEMSPRFAFFGHGSNDIGNGAYIYENIKELSLNGYPWAMQDYYRQVNDALDLMIAKGVIPLMSGIAPNYRKETWTDYRKVKETDPLDYPRFVVLTFNAISRGIAEYRQIPWFDTYHSFIDLENHGLRTSDNIHGSTKGSPCDFTAEGLKYGVNQRNLGSIQMLNMAWQTVVKGAEAPDKVEEPFKGSGSKDDPFIITSLPYTHTGDTSKSQNKNINAYAGSCSKSSEEGGEYYYKLELKEKRRVKLFAVSARNVDVDLHVLKGNVSAEACMVRSDIFMQGYLEAGTYYFSVDTYGKTNGTGADKMLPGQYLFGIHECEGEDKRCDVALHGY